MKIGVPDKEVISACRRLIFTDPKGISHSHIVQIQVEDSDIPLWGSTRIPVFDVNFIRESSLSPQPSPALSDNILMLAQPEEAVANPNLVPNPLLVDLNIIPDDSSNIANPTFLETLIPNPLDMQSMTYTVPIPIPNTPLPEIGSPQMPLPLLPQLDMHPHIQELAPNSQAPLLQPITQLPPPQPEIQVAAIAQAEPADLQIQNDAPEDPIMELDQPENPPLLQAPVVDQPAPQMAQQINPVAQAPAGVESEARHSLRLKVKEAGRTSKNKGKQGNSSGNTIIQQFPYINLTDQKIISLFEVSGLSLGLSLDHKLKVVAHIRSLTRSRFSDTCQDLIPKIPPTPPVDISDIIMSIDPENTIVSND